MVRKLFKELKAGDQFKNFETDTGFYTKRNEHQAYHEDDPSWNELFSQYEPVFISHES